jgi:hypothetical protein
MVREGKSEYDVLSCEPSEPSVNACRGGRSQLAGPKNGATSSSVSRELFSLPIWSR